MLLFVDITGSLDTVLITSPPIKASTIKSSSTTASTKTLSSNQRQTNQSTTNPPAFINLNEQATTSTTKKTTSTLISTPPTTTVNSHVTADNKAQDDMVKILLAGQHSQFKTSATTSEPSTPSNISTGRAKQDQREQVSQHF